MVWLLVYTTRLFTDTIGIISGNTMNDLGVLKNVKFSFALILPHIGEKTGNMVVLQMSIKAYCFVRHVNRVFSLLEIQIEAINFSY